MVWSQLYRILQHPLSNMRVEFVLGYQLHAAMEQVRKPFGQG